jgi:hypothetical protein
MTPLEASDRPDGSATKPPNMAWPESAHGVVWVVTRQTRQFRQLASRWRLAPYTAYQLVRRCSTIAADPPACVAPGAFGVPRPYWPTVLAASAGGVDFAH